MAPGRRVAMTTIPHSKNTIFGVEGSVTYRLRTRPVRHMP